MTLRVKEENVKLSKTIFNGYSSFFFFFQSKIYPIFCQFPKLSSKQNVVRSVYELGWIEFKAFFDPIQLGQV